MAPSGVLRGRQNLGGGLLVWKKRTRIRRGAPNRFAGHDVRFLGWTWTRAAFIAEFAIYTSRIYAGYLIQDWVNLISSTPPDHSINFAVASSVQCQCYLTVYVLDEHMMSNGCRHWDAVRRQVILAEVVYLSIYFHYPILFLPRIRGPLIIAKKSFFAGFVHVGGLPS